MLTGADPPSSPSPSDRSRSNEATKLSGSSTCKSSSALPTTSCSTVASKVERAQAGGAARCAPPEPPDDVLAHSEPSPLPLLTGAAACDTGAEGAGGVVARSFFLSGGSAEDSRSARLVPQSSAPPSSRAPPNSSAAGQKTVSTRTSS